MKFTHSILLPVSIILTQLSARSTADAAHVRSTPFLVQLQQKYAHQETFLQAVQEMYLSLEPLFNHPDEVLRDKYKRAFQILTEPERTISFRVPWEDDNGVLQMNRGYRVEFSSALGPFKGGLRFHPSVDEGILKFLGFEQIFKNALLQKSGLQLGGGKGGSDFDPKNKSDAEVKRFCQSFMTELHRHISPNIDVPAGDIGVGGREIGYLFGQYKRLTNSHGDFGVLTGKSLTIGGSHIRKEATGYGLVYITKLAIEDKLKQRDAFKGKRCVVSGSGNVSQYACEKLLDFGAKVVSVSDSNGVLHFENGMSKDDWEVIVKAKQHDRLRLSEIEGLVSGNYFAGKSPWTLEQITKYDFAFPCATQNEIDEESIQKMIDSGLRGVFEGANLPTSEKAQEILRRHTNIIYIPGKAANAGGVGCSGLEMSQNSQKLGWNPNVVDEKLKDLMAEIYQQLIDTAGPDGSLEVGANQAGFLKVVDAMDELGWL